MSQSSDMRARIVKRDLINWPSCQGDGYQDTGEGGLFAYACWAADVDDPRVSSRTAGGCHVDVWATLNSPDVCLTGGPALDAVYPTPHTYIQAPKTADLDSDAWTAYTHRSMCEQASAPLRAAVFLGSTSAAAWDYAGERYFNAGREHLTPAGLAMVEALERAYGSPALLLTFLDT